MYKVEKYYGFMENAEYVLIMGTSDMLEELSRSNVYPINSDDYSGYYKTGYCTIYVVTKLRKGGYKTYHD